MRCCVPLVCPYHSHSTSSTPQAIACGSDWRCFMGWVTSSSSGVLQLSSPLPLSSLIPAPCHHSTHPPPHKQLLVRLGVGGVSSSCPCSVPRHRLSSSHSPCALVVIPLLSSLSLPSLSSFPRLLSFPLSSVHQPSTSQAGARKGGGRCSILWHGGCCCHCPHH